MPDPTSSPSHRRRSNALTHLVRRARVGAILAVALLGAGQAVAAPRSSDLALEQLQDENGFVRPAFKAGTVITARGTVDNNTWYRFRVLPPGGGAPIQLSTCAQSSSAGQSVSETRTVGSSDAEDTWTVQLSQYTTSARCSSDADTQTDRVERTFLVDRTAPTSTDDVPTDWVTAEPFATLTGSDGTGSGLGGWHFVKGAEPLADPTLASPKYDSKSKPVLAHGEVIKYFAVDVAGNREAIVNTSAPAQIDNVAPATSHNVPTTWQAAPVAVQLTPGDPAPSSGQLRTYYTKGIDPPYPTTASAVFDPADPPRLENNELVRFFSVDRVGNAEAPKSSPAANVDEVSPFTSDDVPAAWQRSEVVVTLTGGDVGGSGVSKTYYTKGTSPATPTTASSVYSESDKPTLGHGEQIRYFSVDGAGNAEEVRTSSPARVDLVAPTTTDDVTTTWRSTSFTVTLTATDSGGSRVGTTYYSKGTSPPDPTTESAVYDPASRPSLTNGERIKYFSVDGAGNREDVRTSDAVQIETSPPMTTDDVATGWRLAPQAVTLTASDTGESGVNRTHYTIGTDPPPPSTGSQVYDPASKPVLVHGQRIRYFSVDRAGNAEVPKSSAVARIDGAMPTTTDNLGTGWATADVIVTLTAIDAGPSGVAQTYYTKGVAPSVPTTASDVYEPDSKPVLADGERIRYFSVDHAGNVENTRTSPAAKVDKLGPTTSDDVPGTAQPLAFPVTLEAVDAGGSGVLVTHYTVGVDPPAPTRFAPAYDPANKPYIGDGERIRYFSVDVAGNAEPVRTSTVAQVSPPPPSFTADTPAATQRPARVTQPSRTPPKLTAAALRGCLTAKRGRTATLRLTLSRGAVVYAFLERQTGRAPASCASASSKVKGSFKLAGQLVLPAKEGSAGLKLATMTKNRKLAPGRYRLRLIADAGGARSAIITRTFAVAQR